MYLYVHLVDITGHGVMYFWFTLYLLIHSVICIVWFTLYHSVICIVCHVLLLYELKLMV